MLIFGGIVVILEVTNIHRFLNIFTDFLAPIHLELCFFMILKTEWKMTGKVIVDK